MKNLYLDDRTLCSELEKHYKDIKFNRKRKYEIRDNIVNFIKLKINEYGMTLNGLTPIQMMDKMLEFANKNFSFECNGNFTIDNISSIKFNFLKKHNKEIIGCINPQYYKDNLIPDCLKTEAKIKISKDFIYVVSLMNLKVELMRFVYNHFHKEDFFQKLKKHINKFLNNPIPENEEFEKIFSDKKHYTFEKYLNAIIRALNHNFYSRHSSLRENAKIRDMKENSEEIISLITEPIDLEEKREAINKGLTEEYRYSGNNYNSNFEENYYYQLAKHIVENLNIKETFKY